MVKLVAAYLLAGLGGNASPSAADIEKILNSVGIKADESRLATLINEMKGKNMDEVVADGQSKLASVPSGGAAAAPAAGGAAPPAAGGAAAAGGAPPKEEKKEEVEEEEEDLGFDLFD